MLYVKPDRPLDGLTVEVLRSVNPVAREIDIPCFLIGATARDILLTHVLGLDTGLGTKDVDFAVAVENWPQFDLIKNRLIETGRFSPDKQPHRLRYRATDRAGSGYPIDIIPFRGAEQPGNRVVWPPDLAVEMTVTGYEEALSVATDVQIEEALVVRVASLPGLAMLKLFAWNDRGHATTKDARDLLILLRHYGTSEENRLYGDDFALLSSVDHDLDRAGARLLGRDVRRLALVSTSDQLLAILADRTRTDRLVTHMMGALPGSEREDLVETLLGEFTQGLQGT